MKKFLSTLLIASMVLSLVPAFSVFAAESVDVISQPRYELEDGELKATGDNYVKNGADDTVSGGKFVRAFDNGEQSVTLKVNSPKNAYYELSVGVITMDGGRAFDVIVNGNKYENIICGISGGSWDGDVKVTKLVVALKKGENTVVLDQDAGNGPSMDYIEFAPIALSDELTLVAGTALKIEAENAYDLNGVKVTDSEVASGGKLVNDIGGDGGNVARYLEFLVNAPADGEATLSLNYFAGMDRNLEISVNGKAATYQFANNGTWGNPGDSASTAADPITITLKKGVNSIKIYNSTGWGPNVDFVEITAAEVKDDGPTGGDNVPTTGDAVVLAVVVSAIALLGTAVVISKKRLTVE